MPCIVRRVIPCHFCVTLYYFPNAVWSQGFSEDFASFSKPSKYRSFLNICYLQPICRRFDRADLISFYNWDHLTSAFLIGFAFADVNSEVDPVVWTAMRSS